MQITQLTFLRFLAASAVVIFHAGRTTRSLSWGDPIWMRANAAVSFFFLLSGFILAHVYGRTGIPRSAEFYVARLARIVPLYWLALLAVALYRWRTHTLHPQEFVVSVFLLQSWIPGWSQVLNVPSWSLSAELFFYLAFPLLLMKMRHLRAATLLALATAVWALNLVLYVVLSRVCQAGDHPLLHDFAVYHPLAHLGTFVVGMALGLLFEQRKEVLRAYASTMIALSVALFLAMLLIPNPLVEYHHNGLFAPIFGLFVLGLSAAPELYISRVFSWPPFVLLGDASYALYILQQPISLAWMPVAQKLALSRDAAFWSFHLGARVGGLVQVD